MDDKSTTWKPIHSFNKRKCIDTRLVFTVFMSCMCIHIILIHSSGKCLADSRHYSPLYSSVFTIVVAALIELSKYRLPTIASTLVTVLENISKVWDDRIRNAVIGSSSIYVNVGSTCCYIRRFYSP